MAGGKRLLCLTFISLVVVRHFQAGPPKAALDVESLVGLTAVENALVAAHLLSDEVQGLYDAQTELLALLVLSHGNILYMTDKAQVMYTKEGREHNQQGSSIFQTKDNSQFALNNQGAGAYNSFPGRIFDDKNVVAVAGRQPVVTVGELRLGDLADGGQDTQAVEEAGIVVGEPQGANNVALGERRGYGRGNEIVGEEPHLSHDGDGS